MPVLSRDQNESDNEMSNSASSSVLHCPRSLYTRLGNVAGGGVPVPVFLTLHPRPIRAAQAYQLTTRALALPKYTRPIFTSYLVFLVSSSIAFPRSPTRSWWGTHHHRQCSCDAHRLPRSRSCIFCCRSHSKLFETCQRSSIP